MLNLQRMKKLMALGAVIAALGIAAAGCGGEKKSAAGDAAQTAKIVGKVATDGSTSMEKVIGSLGEAFCQKNKDASFTYNPTGSGSGIKAAAEGRTDIGLSSRYLKEAEKQQGLKETVLAYDGIAIVVHKDNPVVGLETEKLAAIYKGEINDWSEIGGKSGAIVRIGREAGSGTRDGFESVTKTSGKCRYSQELTSTGDVIAKVASNQQAIGYTSLAAVGTKVKALSINNVAPTEKSILDGSYKIQRPFVLVTKKGEALTGAAKAFYDFALSGEAAKIINKAGAIPPSK